MGTASDCTGIQEIRLVGAALPVIPLAEIYAGAHLLGDVAGSDVGLWFAVKHTRHNGGSATVRVSQERVNIRSPL